MGARVMIDSPLVNLRNDIFPSLTKHIHQLKTITNTVQEQTDTLAYLLKSNARKRASTMVSSHSKGSLPRASSSRVITLQIFP
jgi:hypothetical protein